MAEYTLKIPIRFGDCDPAGILYYPRYFDLYHQTMEQWFGDSLGVPYAQVVGEMKVGVPTVSASTTYVAPLAFGEVAAVALSVEKIGRTSLHFRYVVRGEDGSVRAEAAVVCVWMELDPGRERFRRSIDAPADLRARIERFRDA